MPVVVAIAVEEVMIRSSAGRHETNWLAGVAGGWRQPEGPVAVMLEADVAHWAENSNILKLQTTELRGSLLVEGHLGPAEDPFRLVLAAGPAAAMVLTEVNGYDASVLLAGGRAMAGVDALLLKRAARRGEGWTVGLRMGGFGHRQGVDFELGLRTGWAF